MILPPSVALQLHVDELRAELAAVSCPVERADIADELHEALERLHALIVPGAVIHQEEQTV